jgi:HAD superfamily hydrolase (TIGR01509 family)
MIRAVIFDMDGVIIDSEPIHFKMESEMFHELKIAVPYEEHCSYVGTSSQNMWEIITKRYSIEEDANVLVKKQHALYLEYLLTAKDLDPIPGVVEFIKDLYQGGFKLILASSANMEVIDLVLKKLKLSHYFMARVSGTELANSKPHPEIFIQSAKLASSELRECIVIEDSQNGITSAKAAGMKCIGFANPNSGVQDLSKADFVIHSFDELNAEAIRAI